MVELTTDESMIGHEGVCIEACSIASGDTTSLYSAYSTVISISSLPDFIEPAPAQESNSNIRLYTCAGLTL